MSGLRFQWTGLTRISGRERRTLMVGMTATVLIIAGAMGTRGAQTWSSYTDALNLKRQRAGRLETSARARPQVTAHLSSARAALLPYRVRLLRGATAEVAAASLQQHVQAIASIAQLQVGRVDVERADSVHTSRLRAIRVVVNAQGDVYGLASFLAAIEGAPLIIVIDEIGITSGRQPWDGARASARQSELLNIELRLHGYYAQD